MVLSGRKGYEEVQERLEEREIQELSGKSQELSVVSNRVANSAIGINARVFGDVENPQGSSWDAQHTVRLVAAVTKINAYLCLTNEYRSEKELLP